MIFCPWKIVGTFHRKRADLHVHMGYAVTDYSCYLIITFLIFPRAKQNLKSDYHACLKALYTFGNCQRPVFSLGVSHHKFITIK